MNNFDDLKLENQLCFSLYATSREVIKLYKPFLDKFNLTYTQYIAMLVLWEYEKSTVKEIGKKLHLDSGTLTPLLKKMESMELIRRYRDINDDRVVIVELSEKGRRLKYDITSVPKDIACKINLEKNEIKRLKDELDNLLEKLKD